MRTAFLVAALSIAACDTAPDGPLSGRYDLTLYEEGAAVATGRVDLRVEPPDIHPAIVSGDWRLEPTHEGRTFGGDGVLRGQYDGTTVRLSLLIGPEGEPALDAGVGLDGTVTGDEIRGEWGGGMSAGPSGTFVARR